MTARSGGSSRGAAVLHRPSRAHRGPYFVDERLDRSDIRADPATGTVKTGVPLALIFLVSRITGASCAALTGATVDVWHCDAVGVYSDANDPSFAGTKGAKFLRGYQTTAANGQRSDFTSQVFFDDALNDQVFTQAPYAQKGTAGRTRNTSDGLFQGSGGKLTLSPTKRGDGYAATFDIGLAV